jgi:hypothetical protein
MPSHCIFYLQVLAQCNCEEFLPFYFFKNFLQCWDGTQGFMYAMQALYHWASHSPSHGEFLENISNFQKANMFSLFICLIFFSHLLYSFSQWKKSKWMVKGVADCRINGPFPPYTQAAQIEWLKPKSVSQKSQWPMGDSGFSHVQIPSEGTESPTGQGT